MKNLKAVLGTGVHNVHVIAALAMIVLIFSSEHFGQTSTPPAPRPAKTFTFTKLEILEKPAPGYTEAARESRVQGRVKLLVTFKANGQVGEVTVVEPLSHGLTERAVDAAKRIRFRPKALNGEPMDEQTTVEYVFNLYYNDDDENAIRTRVAVLSAPKPNIEFSELPASFEGRLDVRVFFAVGGDASVFEMPSGLSSTHRAKIEEAVKKIKYRPAVHKNGSRVSVTRTMTYVP